ncbi:GGDEF domain-containing protein [Candidatus Sumerlaeota bacterium]|nr:GGDEF domain-containing protein [Candidatus Sumerlaeota bacterium]
MTMLFVGDTLFMIAETADVSIPTNLLAVPYALTYVAAITLMLHPSMRLVTEPLPVDETTQGRGRLAFVAIALVIPALVAVTRVNEKPSDRIALATIVIALTAAAVWRMLRAIRGFARSEATLAHRATHDSLTGLPNRAYVQDSVDRSLSRLQLGAGGTAVSETGFPGEPQEMVTLFPIVIAEVFLVL